MLNRILILTNNAADADMLKEVLSNARDGPFVTEWLTQLADGLVRLQAGDINAVLVDLTLPDSKGIFTFDRLFAAAPHTPILTLSGVDEESLARDAVDRGAQGYLSKGFFSNNLIPQALRSIIQRKAVEETLFQEKTRAEIALNSISDAVICTDLASKVNYLNDAAETMTGWTREEALGMPVEQVFKIINGETRQADQHPVACVLKTDKPRVLNADTLLIRRDGSETAIADSVSPIHDWNQQQTGAVIVFHDVSAAQAMTVKMTHLAQHDFLTNLPNRVLLNDRIAQAITLAKRQGGKLAVLFLDLDNFKHINDSLGHATGDKVLKSVTQRLSDCMRSSDTVSRQGGDEFVILLAQNADEDDAAQTADKILAALALPHQIDNGELHVTTSIGISVYPADGTDADALIKSADIAMYHAKENGRNNYQFFRADMNTRAVERQFIESSLRRALEKQEFVLHYQPKVNLETGQITGAEALLRWTHAYWGMVLPERFLPIAEDCGLIVPIGRWALAEACRQAQIWLDAGLPPITMAVNISALEFRQKHFFESVCSILSDTGLAAHHLELEITESALMRNAEASSGILQAFKDMGVQLAVDDFGTGYSSLSYLKQFPIDVLKIDQSFVQDLLSDDEGIIVSAVIGMGNSLKLRVVAEGVESAVQLAFLKARHCEEGQGNLFSPPLPADEFAALLAHGVGDALKTESHAEVAELSR